MAHLIKLHHFPSRYETNIYQYAGRFTQIKQRRFQNYLDKAPSYEPEETIKAKFFDDLYKWQLIWAMSTAKMESQMVKDYRYDDLLKQILRMFDDTAMILYYPTFIENGAEIDCNLIILTPHTVWCIQTVTGERESVFQGVDAYEWKEITSSGITPIPNPYISLDRTITSVKRIFDDNKMEAEIKGCIYVPESYVEFVQYGTPHEVIDRTKVKNWVSQINHHRSTLKHGQLRAAELLLKMTKTTADLRV